MMPADPLRDIHLPDAIGWWPPAIGWWLLLAGLLILIIVLRLIYSRRIKNRWRQSALQEWREIQVLQDDPQRQTEIISRISILLRRVAITRFPQQEVAGLTGEAWLQFLDQTMDQEKPFQQGEGRLLITAPYQQTTVTDTHVLLALCQRWLQQVQGE
ncbi:MAG: DUF4381 domain-containing protein [Gammaproteobacteria bacterium]|nr:DUF4381 domain-containing protein [Gammaproteobacteria bacterium]